MVVVGILVLVALVALGVWLRARRRRRAALPAGARDVHRGAGKVGGERAPGRDR